MAAVVVVVGLTLLADARGTRQMTAETVWAPNPADAACKRKQI